MNTKREGKDDPAFEAVADTPALQGADLKALLLRVLDYFEKTSMGEPNAYHNPLGIKELRADLKAALSAVPSAPQQQERERFEAWHREKTNHKCHYYTDENGICYTDERVQHAWWGWQAALAAHPSTPAAPPSDEDRRGK